MKEIAKAVFTADFETFQEEARKFGIAPLRVRHMSLQDLLVKGLKTTKTDNGRTVLLFGKTIKEIKDLEKVLPKEVFDAAYLSSDESDLSLSNDREVYKEGQDFDYRVPSFDVLVCPSTEEDTFFVLDHKV